MNEITEEQYPDVYCKKRHTHTKRYAMSEAQENITRGLIGLGLILVVIGIVTL